MKWPAVRGRLLQRPSLAQHSWFQTGGTASALLRPYDEDDLALFLTQRPQHMPLYVLGGGSNILIRDGFWDAVMIKLGSNFAHIQRHGNTLVVGAGALDRTIAQYAAQEGLSGFEFLIGIPGTLGGAISMNAGAYGHDMKGITQWVDVMHPNGQVERLSQLHMEYRHTQLPKGCIVLRAELRGRPAPHEEIAQRMLAFFETKQKTQPTQGRTGGSTFKNPPNARAWELIESAGCRGLAWGDAQMSPLHCNFMINRGRATTHDLEQLGTMVQQRVWQHTGVKLQWEINRIGVTGDKRQWAA